LSADSTVRVAITIKGVVQGVGFRPFVNRLAERFHLTGFVFNSGEGVAIELEGKSEAVTTCIEALKHETPPLARIDTFSVQSIACKAEQTFVIQPSKQSSVQVMIPADIAMCEACERELLDSTNRRYHYPFINCTDCGPRYSIIEALPYDRINSSMRFFAMCAACESEYNALHWRRFHAQPISCFSCGPTLSSYPKSAHIIDDAAKVLQDGGVVALQGIGGFHLLANALDEEAVNKVRALKHRPKKPLAVMCNTLEHARQFALLTPSEAVLMQSLQRPIVIAQKRQNIALAKSVAPDIDAIGLFLPYSPLHLLLMQAIAFPVVATSANISDMPLCTSYEALKEQFDTSALFVVAHDRAIVNACDDSVISLVDDKPVMMRLSRGYAPLNLMLQQPVKEAVLAVGANQKSTIALYVDGHAILSPHIGDLQAIQTVELFKKTIQTFLRLYNIEPTTIVHDKHPGYASTKWAQAYGAAHPQCEIMSVAHHYAHALSVMAEYQLDGEALAFCFDGTGYGEDGTLWGAEVLRVTPRAFERITHFKSIALIGGEQAIKEPLRQLAGVLFSRYTPTEIISMQLPCFSALNEQTLRNWYTLFSHKTRTIDVTSMGRLFDCVFALCGFNEPIAYEGQSGMILERLAREDDSAQTYTLDFNAEGIDYMPMIEAIIAEQGSCSVQRIARKFINTIAQSVIDVAQPMAPMPLIFCGGVFQNRLLLETVIALCKQHSLSYYVPQQVPINDGGIAMGQLYYAIKREEREHAK